MPLKRGECPFGHKGPVQPMPDGRGRLCECSGGVLYKNGRLVGSKPLVDALGRLIEDLIRGDNRQN